MTVSKRFDAKKFIIILATVLFVLVTMFCFVLLTTVKRVEVHFAVGDNTDTLAVQSVVDKNVGKNLLTIDEEEIKTSLSGFSYVEVVSVEKKFPNVVKVMVKERREIYGVEFDDKVHVLGEDGHLLKTVSKNNFEFTRDVIKLDLGAVKIIEANVGQVLKTDSDELLTSVLDMTKSANLNNSIKEISVIKYAAAGELSDVEFVTYTGVKICVYKAEEMGVEKMSAAFNVYDTQVSDYEKATFTLYASYNFEKQRIEVTWSDRAVSEN